MRILSTFLTLVSILGPPLARAQECDHRIYFLPQSHETEYTSETTQDQRDQIVSSQLNVARFLDRFTNTPVFTEQATERDFKVADFPDNQISNLKAYMRSIFPQGLPEDFESLNKSQKQKLYDNGGEFIQFMLGKVDVLRRVVRDKKRSDEIFNPINQWVATNHLATNRTPLRLERWSMVSVNERLYCRFNSILEIIRIKEMLSSFTEQIITSNSTPIYFPQSVFIFHQNFVMLGMVVLEKDLVALGEPNQLITSRPNLLQQFDELVPRAGIEPARPFNRIPGFSYHFDFRRHSHLRPQRPR